MPWQQPSLINTTSVETRFGRTRHPASVSSPRWFLKSEFANLENVSTCVCRHINQWRRSSKADDEERPSVLSLRHRVLALGLAIYVLAFPFSLSLSFLDPSLFVPCSSVFLFRSLSLSLSSLRDFNLDGIVPRRVSIAMRSYPLTTTLAA